MQKCSMKKLLNGFSTESLTAPASDHDLLPTVNVVLTPVTYTTHRQG